MTLNDRDRRILLILLPILLLVGYWFLLLSPKRDDLQTAQDEQAAAEQRRDAAEARVAQLQAARQTFASDYAAVVRLGKAIPSTIDAPSLLVQLDAAADGTRIDFNSVQFGERASGISAPATPAAAGSQPEGNAAAGGAPAQTAPGQAAEGAGEAANQADQANQGVQAATTPPSEEAATGTQPGEPATTATPASQATGGALDSVALTFDFTGTYFDLADFFHRLKRFVYVRGDEIFIRGRLLTIDSLTFGTSASGQPGATSTGELTTTVGATVYLTPRSQGVTAGATPAGPAPETPPAEQQPAGTARRSAQTTATAVIP